MASTTVSDQLFGRSDFYKSTTTKPNIYAFHDDDDEDDNDSGGGGGGGSTTSGDAGSEDGNVDIPISKKSDNENSESRISSKHIKTFDELIESIGFMNLDENLYKQLCQFYPLVSIDDHLCVEDRNLANIFKCNPYKGCFFTTDDPSKFREHLEQKHAKQRLNCLYCPDPNDNWTPNKIFKDPSVLINHMIREHLSQLRYQCNLCFYRARSTDHILIHQSLEHLKQFEEAIKRKVLEDNDNDRKLNSFQKAYLQYLNQTKSDDETEIEENDDKVILKVCRIIKCTNESDALDSPSGYLARQAYQQKWDLSEAFPLKCAFCDALDAEHFENEIVWAHYVTAHREHPFIVYDMSKKGKNEHSPVIDEENVFDETMELFALLAMNALPSSYDEKLMRKAFKRYRKGIDLIEKKGTKRKLNETDNDEEKDGDEVDGKEESSNFDGSKPDNSSSSKSWSFSASAASPSSSSYHSKALVLPTTTKRRRIFGRFISDRTWNRTKSVVGMVTTAVAALGFYHFAQNLPFSIQKLVENSN